MKQILKIMAVAMMTVTTVTFLGCDKEDNTNNGSGTTQPTPAPNPEPQPATGWVDLGLPSGLLWAECNVGATIPEGYGDYFAWGETTTKSVFDWSTYAYCTVDGGGDLDELTKYNTSTTYGPIDNLTTLEASDDAATANMGNGARTPTKEEWQELIDNTTAVWTSQNGVSGRKFTATNGNSIFLPAAGYHKDSESYFLDNYGYYASASLNGDNPRFIGEFYFYSDAQEVINNYQTRCTGLTVRAVRATHK